MGDSKDMDFLTIGELLVDFCQTAPGPHGYPQYEAMPGGAPANVAVAMAKWGLRAGFIGNVGQDALGAMLAATLEQNGVDCSRLLPSRQTTSLAMVSLAPDGDRSFAFYWKDTSCATLEARLAESGNVGSRIFHFGSVTLSTPQSRETTLAAVRAARDGGAIISFDANLRPGLWAWEPERAREPILEAMALSGIVKLSEEELYFLAGIQAAPGAMLRDDPRTGRLMAGLREDTGVELLFVTFGSEGARWLGRRGEGALDSLKVKAVDTTGAGDCFMAGVLSRFLALGRDLPELSAGDCLEMARRGVTAGALSTTRRGAIPSIPALDEIALRLPA